MGKVAGTTKPTTEPPAKKLPHFEHRAFFSCLLGKLGKVSGKSGKVSGRSGKVSEKP